jgi:hypothetical protein
MVNNGKTLASISNNNYCVYWDKIEKKFFLLDGEKVTEYDGNFNCFIERPEVSISFGEYKILQTLFDDFNATSLYNDDWNKVWIIRDKFGETITRLNTKSFPLVDMQGIIILGDFLEKAKKGIFDRES